MTAARRTRKRYVWLAALALAFPVVGSALQAATTERVVVDRYTGLAIYGIDPVAYFTSGKPTAGRENFELRHDFVAKFDRQGLIAALKESTVEFVEAA